MAGLRAGSVDSVALNDDNRIEVTLNVTHDFAKRVKDDSIARVIRPFIIGDKVVEITVGSKEAKQVTDRGIVHSEDTLDLMDLLGGGKLGPYLETLDSLLRNLQTVAEAFADPKRSKAMIGMFDQMLPTMIDLREMTQQMTKDKSLRHAMVNIQKLTHDMNDMLPEMKEFSKQLPELGANSAVTMKQMALLTSEINKFMPIIAEVAPKMPEVSQKGVEALREAVIVLRAMQKSFLLRGSVKEVKEETAKEEQQEKTVKPGDGREPATAGKPGNFNDDKPHYHPDGWHDKSDGADDH
jgi:phospholipid/cholesterol/gamma-HCH transport system substrate-binding protein